MWIVLRDCGGGCPVRARVERRSRVRDTDEGSGPGGGPAAHLAGTARHRRHVTPRLVAVGLLVLTGTRAAAQRNSGNVSPGRSSSQAIELISQPVDVCTNWVEITPRISEDAPSATACFT